MNILDRIRSDSILHAIPAREVAKGKRLGGYDIPYVPGRVAVLVRGTEARMLSKARMQISKDYLDSCVAYIRTGMIEIPVNFTEKDAIRTSESYPCSGRITLQAVLSEDETDLKAFAVAHVSAGREQAYGPEEVTKEVRPSLIGRIRREVQNLSLEQVGTASERICEALRTDPGEGVLSILNAHGFALGETWSLDLKPVEYSEEDQKAFEEVRAEAEELLKKRSEPASKMIYQVMSLHNISSSFRVNIWFSRRKDRPAWRGGIGVYVDPTHKDSGVYHHGDDVSLDVLCSQDAYLYLLDLDSEGELSLLFPNELQRENRITSGQTFRLPDAIPELFGGKQQHWAILPEAPPGTERLKAIATLQPITILPEIMGRANLLYCRKAADALPDVVEMVEKIRRLAPSVWADCACQFHIE